MSCYLSKRRSPNLSRDRRPLTIEEIAKDSGVVLARADGKDAVASRVADAATALALAVRTVSVCLERLLYHADDAPVG